MNDDLRRKIRAAELRHAPEAEKKLLHRQNNTFLLNQSDPIYRIFQTDYLLEDIGKQTLTHVPVSPDVWDDEYENPLLNKIFTEEETGEKLSLRGIVGNLFGLSWSLERAESHDLWDRFSHGSKAVRVATTVDRLLDRVMSTDNKFYMLSHFLGKVYYQDQEEIDSWLNSARYLQFLGSLGHEAVLSAMVLRSQFSDEQEARLVYWHHLSDNNLWVTKNVELHPKFCRVPFDWHGVLDEVVVAPTATESELDDTRAKLAALNVTCPVVASGIAHRV